MGGTRWFVWMRSRKVYGAFLFFFFSSRRRHTRCSRDWSSDVCSSDLDSREGIQARIRHLRESLAKLKSIPRDALDRKSTRLNSSHGYISYAVFCLKKKKKNAAPVYISRTSRVLSYTLPGMTTGIMISY